MIGAVAEIVTGDGRCTGNAALDFESVNETYEEIATIGEVHQYVEGGYTIFPHRKYQIGADGLDGPQMSLFDIVSASNQKKIQKNQKWKNRLENGGGTKRGTRI